MPTYIYKCEKCEREFEVQQRITAESLTECILEDETTGEPCGGKVHRKISKDIGLVFNGKGFYLTDYAGKKSKPAESCPGKCNSCSATSK